MYNSFIPLVCSDDLKKTLKYKIWENIKHNRIALKLADMPEEMWGVHGSMNYNVHVHVLSLWDKTRQLLMVNKITQCERFVSIIMFPIN